MYQRTKAPAMSNNMMGALWLLFNSWERERGKKSDTMMMMHKWIIKAICCANGGLYLMTIFCIKRGEYIQRTCSSFKCEYKRHHEQKSAKRLFFVVIFSRLFEKRYLTPYHIAEWVNEHSREDNLFYITREINRVCHGGVGRMGKRCDRRWIHLGPPSASTFSRL